MFSFLRNHTAVIRLLLSALGGALAFLLLSLLSARLPLPMRGAIGWDVAASVFLLLTFLAVCDATPDHLRSRASLQDSKMWVILAIIVVAAAASLASIALVLQQEKGIPGPALGTRVAVAGATVVASWTFVNTTFAIRYAHYFYGDRGDKKGQRAGLAFPGGEAPDFWDFLYYAFVVGMTCQVSDVQVTSRPMRRLTLAHGVLAFFFNAGVLALAVNILAAVL
jgi:uncharacterized membrane protein